MAIHFLIKCGDGDISKALGESEYTLKSETIDVQEVEGILVAKGYTVNVTYDLRVRVGKDSAKETDNKFVKLDAFKGSEENLIEIDVSPNCDVAHQFFGIMTAFQTANGVNLYENLLYKVVDGTIDDLEEIIETKSIVFNVADPRFV